MLSFPPPNFSLSCQLSPSWPVLPLNKNADSFLLPLKALNIILVLYLLSMLFIRPPAPSNFPKYPFFLSSFSLRFIVFCFLPSSMPVNSAWSLFLSYTCTSFTASALRFLTAIPGSSPKNSSPSTNTFCTCSPMAFILPSLSTCMPGSFFSNSSTLALALTLKLSAVYETVSPLIFIGDPVLIITSCSNLLFGVNETVCKSRLLFFISMSST